MDQNKRSTATDGVQINALAQALGNYKLWVNYRLETAHGKTQKIPYAVAGGLASSTNPLTWSTYAEAIHKSDKVSIACTLDQKFLAIDIDHCIKEKSISHEKKDIIINLISEANTYTEISPSGNGLHLYLILTESLSLIANKKAPFECYTSKRFLTVTGNSFGSSRAVRTVSIDEAMRILSIMGYPWGRVVSDERILTPLPLSLDDSALLEKIFSSKNGAKVKALYDGDISHYGGDESSADMALCSFLAFWTRKDTSRMERIWLGSSLGAREKTQKRKDYRDKTISAAISRCKEVYNAEEMRDKNEVKKQDEKVIKNKFRVWSMNEILNTDFGQEEWIVKSLIPKQGKMVLSGIPGNFKTWITMHIAICVSRGIPVFNEFKTAQGSVLIIDEEDNLRLLKNRLTLLGTRTADSIHYISQGGIKIDNEETCDDLAEFVAEHGVALVIIDSLVRVHGLDENSAGDMAKVFGNMQKIINAGASILFTHHHKKQNGNSTPSQGEKMRGSSDILAAVDCHVTLERDKRNDEILVFNQTKLRQSESIGAFEVKIIMNGFQLSGFEYVGDHDDEKPKAGDNASSVVVSILVDGMKSRQEIQKVLKERHIGKSSIDVGIKMAEDAGLIERVPKAHCKNKKMTYYRVPFKSNSDLPVSQLPMDVGNQEESRHDKSGQDEWFPEDSP